MPTVELSNESCWDLLSEVPTNTLHTWINQFNVQVQAIIIHKLSQSKAKEVIALYSSSDIADIISRLSTISLINQEAYDMLQKYIMDNYLKLLPIKGVYRFDLLENLSEGRNIEIAAILSGQC